MAARIGAKLRRSMLMSVNGRGMSSGRSNPLIHPTQTRGVTAAQFNKTRLRKIGRLNRTVRRTTQRFPP